MCETVCVCSLAWGGLVASWSRSVNGACVLGGRGGSFALVRIWQLPIKEYLA